MCIRDLDESCNIYSMICHFFMETNNINNNKKLNSKEENNDDLHKHLQTHMHKRTTK
jgi:hypothetical protein